MQPFGLKGLFSILKLKSQSLMKFQCLLPLLTCCHCIILDFRASKLPKPNDFRRRLPHISANALAEVVADIQRNGIPQGGHSRGLLRAARDQQCKHVGPYGAILVHCTLVGQAGDGINIAFANPFALLHEGVSPNLQKLFASNVLSNNRRKLQKMQMLQCHWMQGLAQRQSI